MFVRETVNDKHSLTMIFVKSDVEHYTEMTDLVTMQQDVKYEQEKLQQESI